MCVACHVCIILDVILEQAQKVIMEVFIGNLPILISIAFQYHIYRNDYGGLLSGPGDTCRRKEKKMAGETSEDEARIDIYQLTSVFLILKCYLYCS